MNMYLVAAAVLTIVVGLAHSVLGEILIFRGMRQDGLVPTNGGGLLRESNVRILWASWHVLTVLGLGIAAVLWWLAMPPTHAYSSEYPRQALALTMLVGAAIVGIATKGRHPGWAGLLGVAILAWCGRAM